jgi:hypothetical protein
MEKGQPLCGNGQIEISKIGCHMMLAAIWLLSFSLDEATQTKAAIQQSLLTEHGCLLVHIL